MTHSPTQPDNFNEELLSGYLDGELSSEEQALVENIVSQDPQARQLLDDLEQLRHCLQEIPAQQPPDDVRQRVLEQIESTTEDNSETIQLPASRRSLSRRGIIPWLAAAAAGIALMFIVPPLLRDNPQVAQNDEAAATGSPSLEQSAPGSADLATDALNEAQGGPAEMAAASPVADGEAEGFLFADEEMPVVYVTVPAEAVSQISQILTTNMISTIDASELGGRFRTGKLLDSPGDLLPLYTVDKDVDGLVVEVAKKRLAISLGSDDGLRQGQQLDVSRGKSYLGRVLIGEVKEDSSFGEMTSKYQEVEIRKGDQVAKAVAGDPVAAGFGGEGGQAAPQPGSEPSDESQRMAGNRRAGGRQGVSILIVEGSPEQLEAAWQQMSQYKNTQLVQQAGPQLRGLGYDPVARQNYAKRNEKQDQSRDKSSVGGTKLAATAQSLDPSAIVPDSRARQQNKVSEELDRKNEMAGSLEKAKPTDRAGQIRIQLIIQISE
jgi:anti-sigma factor RsiW